MNGKAQVRVGISGWTYAPWRGVFYPPKLPQKNELAFASRQVRAIEINGTFYRQQKPASFRHWHDEAPADFMFSVKASGFITHKRRLKDCAVPLANFFASGLLLLRHKLGPILWQLPPSLPRIDERFEEFMAMLPRTWHEAAVLAARHDSFIKSDEGIVDGGEEPIRHAFEFRHASFRDEEFIGTMRRLGLAVVVVDSAPHALGMEELTADHVYLRLHGQAPEYAESGYSEEALQKLAAKIQRFARQPGIRLVSAFFDNDAKAHAPANAQRLTELLDLPKAA